MSDECPVVMIEGEGGSVRRINLSDYDEKIHKLAKEPKKAAPFKVVKEGKKFVIVNEAGEKQGDTHETKEDAELMLSLLVGE
jgi:hypothetical protein